LSGTGTELACTAGLEADSQGSSAAHLATPSSTHQALPGSSFYPEVAGIIPNSLSDQADVLHSSVHLGCTAAEILTRSRPIKKYLAEEVVSANTTLVPIRHPNSASRITAPCAPTIRRSGIEAANSHQSLQFKHYLLSPDHFGTSGDLNSAKQ
jgi:hypothetical protein